MALKARNIIRFKVRCLNCQRKVIGIHLDFSPTTLWKPLQNVIQRFKHNHDSPPKTEQFSLEPFGAQLVGTILTKCVFLGSEEAGCFKSGHDGNLIGI